jgi:hypothetical protein
VTRIKAENTPLNNDCLGMLLVVCRLSVGEWLDVGVGVALGAGIGVGVSVDFEFETGVGVDVADGVGVNEVVGVGSCEGDAVGEGDGDGARLEKDAAAGLLVGCGVVADVGMGVSEGVELTFGVGIGEGIGAADGVGVGELVGVGLMFRLELINSCPNVLGGGPDCPACHDPEINASSSHPSPPLVIGLAQ